jgi:hypothetical protein
LIGFEGRFVVGVLVKGLVVAEESSVHQNKHY